MDIYKEYDDVFEDIVKCYLENNNINKVSDDELKIIVRRLIMNNEPMWEFIYDCVSVEFKRIKELRKKK